METLFCVLNRQYIIISAKKGPLNHSTACLVAHWLQIWLSFNRVSNSDKTKGIKIPVVWYFAHSAWLFEVWSLARLLPDSFANPINWQIICVGSIFIWFKEWLTFELERHFLAAFSETKADVVAVTQPRLWPCHVFSGPPEFYNGSEQTGWQRTASRKNWILSSCNLPAEWVPAQDSQCALGAPIILSIPLWLGLNPSFHQVLWGTLRIPESVGRGIPDHSELPQACQGLFLASAVKRIREWPH